LFMRRTYSMFRHMCERADKVPTSVPFTLKELRRTAIAYVFGGRCQYCIEPLKPKTFSLDHRVPIERGGSWEMSNLDVICDPCNRAKGTMTGDEFVAVLRVLRTMPDATRREVLGRLKAGAAMRRLTLVKRKAATA